MGKPFASSADTLEKNDTLEILGDGVYALTAEGDPNVGAVEGEGFLVAIESRATANKVCLPPHISIIDLRPSQPRIG